MRAPNLTEPIGIHDEARSRLAPVRGFSEASSRATSGSTNDGPRDAPPYPGGPELRHVAMKPGALVVQRGIDVKLAREAKGGMLLHECVLRRDSAQTRQLTQKSSQGLSPTPLSLALSFGRRELAEQLRAH